MFTRGLILISQILIFSFWPISFFLTNQPTRFEIFKNSQKQGTVFRVSPLDYDTLVKKIGLFPNRNLARLEQNKLTPIVSRYSLNFFSLIDPNNYFFGFHPRENVIPNQNLLKFPPLSVIFLLIGLYNWQTLKNNRQIFIQLLIFSLLLSFLKTFDGFDLILYLPLAIISIHGLQQFAQKQSVFIIPSLFLFCLTSIVDLLRVILIR